MIKIFAPMLGSFTGRGRLVDGTEVALKISGQETLDDVAYAFRVRLKSQETDSLLLNAYMVMALNEQGKLELQFYDTRQHVHTFLLVGENGVNTSLEKHLYCFEGVRDRGTPVRISFEVVSAQSCVARFESMGKHNQWREHWTVPLERDSADSGVGVPEKRVA